MSSISRLRPIMVETIPTRLQAGELYISKRYRTSVHLCCCGCGLEVVAPLNPAKWQLTEYRDGSVSLCPSIGNWSFPCRSHYWIERSRVRWSHAMSTFEIDRVRQRDRAAVEYQARPSMRAQTPAITPPTQQSRPTTSFWQRLRRFLGI